MYCTNCGRPVDEDSQFCNFCGAYIADPTQGSSNSNYRTSEQSSNSANSTGYNANYKATGQGSSNQNNGGVSFHKIPAQQPKSRKPGFFSTEMGRYVIIGISMVVIWGLFMFAISNSGSTLAYIIAFVCAFFGWQALTRIQPTMFIWMPLGGWVIYFVVKLILSIFIGVFVAPFIIGRMVGNTIHGTIRK